MTKEEYISRSLDENFRLWLGRAALWGCALVLLLGGMDYVVTPENFSRFLRYRVFISAMLLIGHFASKRLPRRSLYALALFLVLTSAAVIELMVLRFGGAGSPYYAGMILLGASVMGFLPARFRFHAIMAVMICLIYFVPIVMTEPVLGRMDFLLSNAFLLLIFATLLLVRFMSGKTLLTDLGLQYDLQRYRQSLEESVAERTAELAGAIDDLRNEMAERQRAEGDRGRLQAQFLQSQKMESIGRLAGGVAHDFNNLLTAIMSYAELSIMKLPPGHPVLGHVTAIRDASEKAASLTHQLLAFSRKQVLAMQLVDLNAVVEGMAKMLRRIIGEDIHLKIRTGSGLGPVLADKGQIEQVLMNLAVNARDAMPSGGQLAIETSAVPAGEPPAGLAADGKAGDYVMLSVADTGKGMTPDVRERMFDPFFTTKDIGKGTGLGLSTVYGIVKQHDGHIHVESMPGKGTTVSLFLPVGVDGRSDSPDEGEPAMPRGRETVLVVEDDLAIRALLREVLEPLGYRVLLTASGEEAMERYGGISEEIHLLLTDVVLPGMNGKQLAERFAVRRPGMKVLFMSGYPYDALSHQGLLGLGASLMHKPVGPVVLATRVRQVLDGVANGDAMHETAG
jgi:signal transduction histidine kinase